jgi:hypothetical protein
MRKTTFLLFGLLILVAIPTMAGENEYAEGNIDKMYVRTSPYNNVIAKVEVDGVSLGLKDPANDYTKQILAMLITAYNNKESVRIQYSTLDPDVTNKIKVVFLGY